MMCNKKLQNKAAVDETTKSVGLEKTIDSHLRVKESQGVVASSDGEIVSLGTKQTIIDLFPEQYIQLELEAKKVGSLQKLLKKSISFYIQFQDKKIALDSKLQIIYNSLDKTNVKEILGDNEKAWYIRGVLLNSLRRYEEAIASFDITLKIQPNFQKAWYKRGIAYYAIDFYEVAIENFNQALELDSNDYLSWFSLGKSLLELEKYDQAIAKFDQALEIKNDFELAKLAKEFILQEQKVNSFTYVGDREKRNPRNRRKRRNQTHKITCPLCEQRLWRIGSQKHFLFYNDKNEIKKDSWIEEFYCDNDGTIWMHISRKPDCTMTATPVRTRTSEAVTRDNLARMICDPLTQPTTSI